MRIAIATETFLPSVDGVVTRLARAVDWLAGHGHDVAVIAPDLGVDAYVAQDAAQTRVPVLGVPAVTYPLYRSRRWARPSGAVARHLERFRPDVVHAAQPDILAAQAVLWSSRNGVPLVTSYHTDIEKYIRSYLPAPLAVAACGAAVRYERSLHARAPITLVTSAAMRRRLEGMGYRGLRVIPRGVDLSKRGPELASDEMRARLTGGEPQRTLLVYAGRVAAEKGIETLRPVADAHPDWALAIVGDGPERAALERVFEGTRTVFCGFFDSDDLGAALASADVFVFPSTTETLGLAIADAQASGVAVLAASSPATCEQIRNEIDGIVYLPGRPDREGGLIPCLERLVADSDLRARIGRGGIEATRGCGWDASGAAIFAAYEDTVELFARGWRAGCPSGTPRGGAR